MVRSIAARACVHAVALSVVVVAVAACSTNLEGPGIDYRSDVNAKKTSLEVPPDLTQVPRDERFSVPDGGGRSSATMSQTPLGPGAVADPGATPAPASGGVAASANAVVRIERDGTQRWIVVNLPPERVWTIVHDFWIQNGFTYRVDNRDVGVLETNWAEDRARMPKDLLRRTLGSIVGSIYDTGERDLFRTRIERGTAGTEVYIAHRGATEVLNASKDGTVWQPRPNDPNLEAEFLQRLLVQFGVAEAAAKNAVAGSPAIAPQTAAPVVHAKLIEGDPIAMAVLEPLDRAWRRVGLALDRTGFTVEERDRLNGIYSVRFIPNEKPDEGGFFSNLFGKKSDQGKAAQYRIVVRADGDAAARVTLLDKDGKPVPPDVTRRVLTLLVNDLR